MSKSMQIIPFATQQVDVRVINSKIGPVVPLVDVARAIGYDIKALKQMIERNTELFAETVGVVTTPSHFEQRLRDGSLQQRKQLVEVVALNSYGVIGLLMKLDYNRIQDEGKRDSIIRFQRWAMQTLGNTMQQPARRVPATARKTFKRMAGVVPPPKGLAFYTVDQATEILNINRRTILRRIKTGIFSGYKHLINGTHLYAIPKHEVDAACLRINHSQTA